MNSLSLPTGINSSAIHVFLLLQWLLAAPHSIEELQQCYEAHPWCARSISDDSIRLYLNTLRELGCQIERPNSKNNYRYRLLSQSFTLTDAEAPMSVLSQLFTTLEASTNRAVILQRSATMKALASYSGIHPEKIKLLLPLIADHPIALKTLIAYTQQSNNAFMSFQVAYQVPTLEEAAEKKTDAVQTWTVIPLGLLQEKGRLYWLVWEVVANQTPQWKQRMLRYDRILSIEPLILPSNIQQYFETLAMGYFNALPSYQFHICCPIGINFSGLGFPNEQVRLAPQSHEALRTTAPLATGDVHYEYTVQTDFTFLLLQRLFALQGYFTVVVAPESFHTELQAWSQGSLANYQ